MTGPAPDPYKILQVDPEAEDEVIVAAYRRLARKYHPDVAAGPEAAARMAALNDAWERIGEPARRAAFDRERRVEAALRHRASEHPDPDLGPSRRAGTPASRPEATGSARATPAREPETVSRDWTSGRSTVGGGYDASMRTADGEGAAGRAPGNPTGSVLNFGRYSGWSLGEIGRTDLDYIEWLDRSPIGRQYREEIDVILRGVGRRRSTQPGAIERRGLFRRR